jgi:hypothetical protein
LRGAEPFGVTCSTPSFLELVGANLTSTGINLAVALAAAVALIRNRERIGRWLKR